MAWRRPGDKPLSEPMMVYSLMHICVAQPQWVKVLIPSIDGLEQNCRISSALTVEIQQSCTMSSISRHNLHNNCDLWTDLGPKDVLVLVGIIQKVVLIFRRGVRVIGRRADTMGNAIGWAFTFNGWKTSVTSHKQTQHFKSPATRLFVQQLDYVNIKQNMKAAHNRLFVRGTRRWPVDPRHKGPVMQKAFPCHNIIMT